MTSRLTKAIDTEIKFAWKFRQETRAERERYKAMRNDFCYGVEFARCQELTNQLRMLYMFRRLAQ